MRTAKAHHLPQVSRCPLLLVALCSWLLPLEPSLANDHSEVLSPSGAKTADDKKTPVDIPLFRESPTVSLPTLEPSPFKQRPLLESEQELKGKVTFTEHALSPTQLIDQLVNTAVARDTSRELLEAKARFHNKKWTRFVGRSKDMLQYMTAYQGFESSSEAADVILEEKLKLKHRAAVEFVRQKQLDAAHVKLTYAVMQLAMGLGFTDDTKKRVAVDKSRKEMIPLVGEEEASKIVESMTAWSRQLKVPESSLKHEPWDVLTARNKSAEILAYSLRSDSVVKFIEARLHRYNHISNFSRVTSKLVNTSLSIIAFSPTFASPAAQAAQFVYVACTGGPEEKKLLKEVYLDRCFESRFERLNQEIALIVNNYNHAILTQNPVLFSCTQSLMEGLTDADTTAAITNESEASLDSIPQKTFGERI